jgi:hypothetical protein
MTRGARRRMPSPSRHHQAPLEHELLKASAAARLAQSVAELLRAIPAAFPSASSSPARSVGHEQGGTQRSAASAAADVPVMLSRRSRRWLSTATARHWRQQLRAAEQRLQQMSPECRGRHRHSSQLPTRGSPASVDTRHRLQRTMRQQARATPLSRPSPDSFIVSACGPKGSWRAASFSKKLPAGGSGTAPPPRQHAKAPSRFHGGEREGPPREAEQPPCTSATWHRHSLPTQLRPELPAMLWRRRAHIGTRLKVCRGWRGGGEPGLSSSIGPHRGGCC